MIKKSITLKGHATSIVLEEAFWLFLKNWADLEKISLPALVVFLESSAVNDYENKKKPNLASIIRVACLKKAITTSDNKLRQSFT